MGTPRLKTVQGDSLVGRRAADGVLEIQLDIPERKIRKSTLPAEMAADPLLLPREIAKEMKVDPKTVSRWAIRGMFGEAPDVIKIPGGHRRIRESAYHRALVKANQRFEG